jgi:hypothetical protein
MDQTKLKMFTRCKFFCVIGDKAEQAYRRSDPLEKRRRLMEAWAQYCEPKRTGNVVQMRKQAPD